MTTEKTTLRIIGQEDLVKDLGNIFNIFQASDGVIKPHHILTGESGNSKSFTVKSLAEHYELGFIEVNAAALTKEGTSGNSLSKALSPMLQLGNKLTVVFVDEFDKLFISGNSNDSAAHETTTGVQNEFLKVLEGGTASVFGDYGKYVSVQMNKVMFVFAGAFNGEADITLDRLRTIGLKTEFLGRVGLVYATKKLSLENLHQILEESTLLNTFLQLFVDVDREKAVLQLKGHIQKQYEMNTLGARLVNTLINQYFIKGGKLDDEEVAKVSFTRTLSFTQQ
jgi:ATP-dependent protease Clp ATPase subunit